MESPRKERAIVDIKATLSKHSEIVENLLPAHAISGCDTVASYYGMGKGSVIKVLKAGYELSAIGNMDAPFQQVLDPATAFISAWYGIKESTDMSHTRVWGKKNGKGHMSAPNLAALPPTNEAFIENVKRAHFQAMLWRNLNVNLLPALNPEEFGWKKDTCNRSLIPTHLPEDAKRVTDYILEMIRVGCSRS
ncbi:DNA-directed RNA polymerases I II and III subunit RPABC1 [Dissostichus eleginoides]|uniref:DNA-directed RNA polymerases I II and III subunit RPABC1 n=1 Tax=Dissostichus eleginoides TaxID=100907 RepID=A0AAD9F2A1_DISEL|nr:DNA-directed RNA polymerases I II and III subunit RPABC1 [Dissostichus eleginoides]